MRTVYPQANRQLAYAFILSGHPERLLLNLLPYLVEVGELFVDVQEGRPFDWFCTRRVAVGGGEGSVDELENERTTGDDALASGQEILAYDSKGISQPVSQDSVGKCPTFRARTICQPTDFQPGPELLPI